VRVRLLTPRGRAAINSHLSLAACIRNRLPRKSRQCLPLSLSLSLYALDTARAHRLASLESALIAFSALLEARCGCKSTVLFGRCSSRASVKNRRFMRYPNDCTIIRIRFLGRGGEIPNARWKRARKARSRVSNGNHFHVGFVSILYRFCIMAQHVLHARHVS